MPRRTFRQIWADLWTDPAEREIHETLDRLEAKLASSERCASCRFFFRRGSKFGDCRIGSPIMRLRLNQSGLITHDLYGSWPSVSEDAHCGQWSFGTHPEAPSMEPTSKASVVAQNLADLG